MQIEAISSANAEHYNWGDAFDGWHLLKSGGLSVIEERVPSGGAEVRHYHERSHQFFYVLSGEATFEIDNKKVVLSAHQGLSVPPGVAHRLLNESEHDLSFLAISAPPSHGDRILPGS